MNITLVRTYLEDRTVGYINADGNILPTVELPWKNNRANVSCVPEGTYKLEPHSSQSHPNVWALVNHQLGVYHWKDPVALRFACLIHSDDIKDVNDLMGCIGIEPKDLDTLRSFLKDGEEHTITIRQNTIDEEPNYV